MSGRVHRAVIAGVAALMCAGAAGCASNPPKAAAASAAPAFATYPTPVIPPSVSVSDDIRAGHERAWQLLQAGDVRGANRAFAAILSRCPDCYPSETGLAYTELAGQDAETAVNRFRQALSKEVRYLPAWEGLVEAELARGRLAESIDALEHVVQLDPQREGARTRLVVLQLKETQSFIDGARVARGEGRPDEARALLDRALVRAPSSASILGEIASLEAARGRFDEAELYARRAVQNDPANAEAVAALAVVADSRDPVRSGGVPNEFRSIGSAASVTRGEAAAFMGLRLERLLAGAPRRVTAVVTDINQHWARQWILIVTGAGVMDVLPNHTFLPAQPMRRDELAASLAALLDLAAAGRPADLERWKSVRPSFTDVPTGHLFYPEVALAVACGALSASDDGRFQPARPVTGAEFVRAVTRVQAIAGR